MKKVQIRIDTNQIVIDSERLRGRNVMDRDITKPII